MGSGSQGSLADLDSPGAGLNDGQWHSVSLTAQRNQLSVVVDQAGASVVHAELPLETHTGGAYHFGGECWGWDPMERPWLAPTRTQPLLPRSVADMTFFY